MRPMPRKSDEARSGAGTSEGAPEGADHSIASSLAFVRCTAACVESWTSLAKWFVGGVEVLGGVAKGRVLRLEGSPDHRLDGRTKDDIMAGRSS